MATHMTIDAAGRIEIRTEGCPVEPGPVYVTQAELTAALAVVNARLDAQALRIEQLGQMVELLRHPPVSASVHYGPPVKE